MSVKVAIVFNLGYPQAVHKFSLPEVSDPQYAVDIASIEDTSALEKARLNEYVKAGVAFTHLRLMLEFFDLENYQGRIDTFVGIVGEGGAEGVMPARSEIPVFEHDSVWDMYQAVGYDPERKSFTQERWLSVAPAEFRNAYPGHVAIHYRDGKAIALYRIELLSDGTLHRQAASLDSFRRRESRRASEAIQKGWDKSTTRWPTIEYTEVQIGSDFDEREAIIPIHSKLPVFRPATLFNFYQAIGYDRVKQCYAKPALGSEASE